MASILDYFIGTAQSKYASIAIFSAIAVICVAILFTNTDISFGNRIAVVLFVFAMCVFPVGISLFELTCIVTGGKQNGKYNLCHVYAWIITGIVILYCTILIIATISSMFTYKKAFDKINATESSNAISHNDANMIAKNMIESQESAEQDTQMHPVIAQEHVEASVPEPVPQPVPEPVSQPVPQPVPQPVEQKREMLQTDVIGYDSDDQPYMEVGVDNFVQQPIKKVSPKVDPSFHPEPFSSTNDSYATL
jgi:hypothetical protein